MKKQTCRQSTLFHVRIQTLVLAAALTSIYADAVQAQTPANAPDVEASNAEPIPVESKIVSLGVFKNGIAVVEERIEIPSSGQYSIPFPPSPLHGTFFISSDAQVTTRSANIEVERSLEEVDSIDWARDFQGRRLQVLLEGEEKPRTVQIVPSGASSQKETANASQEPYYLRSSSSLYSPSVNNNAGGKGVFLKGENGEIVWTAQPSDIRKVVFLDDVPNKFKRTEPRLIFDVRQPQETKQAPEKWTIKLFYLTRGLCWAPQYCVDSKDYKSLAIEQTAVLINDWRDFADVPVVLYSGFPQIALKNAGSPLSTATSMNAFFLSLQNADPHYDRNSALMSQMVTNAAVSFNDLQAAGQTVNLPESNDGVDVFSQPIGKLSLKKGERSLTSVGKGSAECRRVVCWNIGEAFDPNQSSRSNMLNDGVQGTAYGKTTSGEITFRSPIRFEEPWDALEFKNPLSFPLTTGPATVVSQGKFLGQNSVFWTNPNEETLLPITKALSVRVSSIENERTKNDPDAQAEPNVVPETLQNVPANASQQVGFQSNLPLDRQITIGASHYRIATIDAEIAIVNQRNEPTIMRMSRQYSGAIVPESFKGFSQTPKTVVLQTGRGDYNLNSHNELQFEETLQPGEKRVLKFSYQKLIRI